MKPVILLAAAALRPVAKADVDCFRMLLADADVRRYLCDDLVFSHDMVMEQIAQSIALDGSSMGIWLIRRRGDGEVIGYAGLLPPSPDHAGAAELSIALYPSAWGLGIARETVEALAVHARAFSSEVDTGSRRENAIKQGVRAPPRCNRSGKDSGGSGCLTRLVATVDAPNERSHRLMLRSGFHRIGERAGPKHMLILYERALDMEQSATTP